MKKSRIKKLSNTFGMLGYMATILLWIWVALLLVPWLSSFSSLKKIIIEQPMPAHHVMTQTSITPPTWALYVIVAIVFFVVLVAIIYVVKLPLRAARTVSQTTHIAARKLATEIVHHPQQVPKKRLYRLTEAIVWYIKTALVVVPVVAVVIIMFFAPLPFSRNVVLAVTVYLVSWPTLWFLLERITSIFDRKHRSSTPMV